MALTPQSSSIGTRRCAYLPLNSLCLFSSMCAVRILSVSALLCKTPDILRTMPSRWLALDMRRDPAPRRCTSSRGQPQLISRKSQSTCSSTNCATLVIVSTSPPAICTPKHFSLSWRRRRASSDCVPSRILPAKAISPTVTSAPSLTQSRRNGKFPTVVSGARIDFPAKSRGFFSRAMTGPTKSSTSTPRFCCSFRSCWNFVHVLIMSVLREKSMVLFRRLCLNSSLKMLVSPMTWPMLGSFCDHSESGDSITPSRSTFFPSTMWPPKRQFNPAGQTPTARSTGHSSAMTGSFAARTDATSWF
mmetsp:Transcript_21984/g.46756  ORF Transcript_21984/g.46756 Transcript_21984/m.46756 type:complete len:303 (-) Transcript_21984:623-1531(-)